MVKVRDGAGWTDPVRPPDRTLSRRPTGGSVSASADLEGALAGIAVHGGPDAQGTALHDFSTNSNACGPCPHALAAVQQADATRYPDPSYTTLRAQLAALHGVAPRRIVMAASASEFIHRVTALAVLQGARAVALPEHSYGDYAHAAQARGLQTLRPADAGWAAAGVQWACEPSSPLGIADPALTAWRAAPSVAKAASKNGASKNSKCPAPLQVVDCAYVPLLLQGDCTALVGTNPLRAFDLPDTGPTAWQLWTPNKALGLTGVRAAYAIAPLGADAAIAALNALAPSWPVGAHGVALLHSWASPASQRWLAGCLPVLRDWKAQQQALCTALGWPVAPGSLANYFAVEWPAADPVLAVHNLRNLRNLRSQGIKVRDCASFGLPGVVRLGVLPPVSQRALRQAVLGHEEGAASGLK